MSVSGSTRRVTLKSSDGETFDVEEKVAMASEAIKHLIDDDCADTVIPLANVTGKILAKVIEYCKKHMENKEESLTYEETSNPLKDWDADFVKVEQETLFDLILAANYLNIQSLLDLTCKTVADMMRGKTPEQIRETFHIINDYTPEEEDEVRKENQWAFDN